MPSPARRKAITAPASPASSRGTSALLSMVPARVARKEGQKSAPPGHTSGRHCACRRFAASVAGRKVPNHRRAARRPTPIVAAAGQPKRCGRRRARHQRQRPRAATPRAASGRHQTARPARTPAVAGRRAARWPAVTSSAATANSSPPLCSQKKVEVPISHAASTPSARRAGADSWSTMPATTRRAAKVVAVPRSGSGTPLSQRSAASSRAKPGAVVPNTVSSGLKRRPWPLARFSA